MVSSFIVSARKYRPDHFNTVLGQKQVTETLKNAIKTGQLAQSFLFCGPRGVGKTSCARILAKTINCTNLDSDFEACGNCDSCRSFQNGNSFNILELDAASNNSVEDIRNLVEQIRYAPQAGKYKIYIIDEVHMLSQNAFNAFLKTLEEPPSYVIFILATTEKHKIIPTILSRCQIFDFNRITVKDAADHLAFIAKNENITFEAEALHLIAQKSDGAMRDALSIFDQISIFTAGNITYNAVIENLHILDFDYYFKITEAVLEESIPNVLLIYNEIVKKGFNGNDFLSGLSSYFRDLLVCKDESTIKLLEVMPQAEEKYLQHSRRISPSFLLSALSITNQAEIHYRNSKNQRLHVELTLMKLCEISSVLDLAKLSLTSHTPKFEEKPNQGKNQTLNDAVKEKEPPVKLLDPLSEEELKKKQISEIESKGFQSAEIRFKIPKKTDLSDQNKLSGTQDSLENPLIQVKRNSPLDSTILSITWKKYLKELENKPESIAHLSFLSGLEPGLGINFKVLLTLENSVHKTLVMELADHILTYLRNELSNDYLHFEYSIRPKEATENKNPFTAQDKLNHLASINPLILELKNKLGLEIDY